jgi:hypothetical protein
MAIDGTSAKIEIDSTPYTVTKGATVAGYTVVGISGGKVQISHNGTVHTLANGELQTF